MKTEKLFEHLCALEREVYQQTIRMDHNRLNVLLHDDFYEIGYSGKTYNKSEALELLAEEQSEAKVFSQDYRLQYAEV